MKLVPLFLLVGLLATSGWAEEKDFKGWKKGDWVRIALDIDFNNETVVQAHTLLGDQAGVNYGQLLLTSYTIWSRIHEISSDHLLITTYYVSQISAQDLIEERAERKRKKPRVSPIKEIYSLETKQIIGIREWPRGGEPPRPWWPL
jgi:hypothetical protein